MANKLNIQSGLSAVLERGKKPWPSHVNRISGLDDPCVRRLFYRRTAWDKATTRDDRFQGILETGNVLEPVIERIVSECGQAATPNFRIVGSQTPTKDNLLKKFQISGSIDGFIQVKNDDEFWETLGVVDIKTSDPNIYRSLNCYEDLSKYAWTRKYRGQLMLYALAHNLTRCCILFVNKSNLYEMKDIWFEVDFDYTEELLQKAEQVNKAIETDTPPEKYNNPDVCPNCEFVHICLPEYSTGGNMKVEENEELEGILEQIETLRELDKEYKDLEKARDLILVKGQDVTCGRFIVTWKRSEVNYKAKEAYKSEQWRKKIVAT